MSADASIPDERSPRVRGRLRGAILERAADLASLDGLDQVSLGRLAGAMQMSKSGLYAYFTSKEHLQLATIDCAWRIFEDRVLEPFDDPLDALLERWIAYFEQEVFPGGCLFVTAGIEFANRDGPVHDALAAAIERQLTALEHAVARDHAGRLLFDTDPSQLAFELHALITAANQHFRISRDPAAFTHARAAITRLLSGDPPRHGVQRLERPQANRSSSHAGIGVARRQRRFRSSDTSDGAPGDDMAGIEIHPQIDTERDLLAIDHVALAVADAGAMEAFLCQDVGMKALGHTSEGALVGAGERATKLLLTPTPGPREPAALARVVLRVADLRRAVASLPPDIEVDDREPDFVTFEGPEGLGLGFEFMAGGGIDYDVDHVVLRVSDPDETRTAFAKVGFVPRGDALHVADKRILLERLPAWSDRPLLDHIAVRVGSIDAIAMHAHERGLEISETSAHDTLTLILPGPERIRIELIAQTPAR